jgi:NAD(P)-dependent dehydrogenase (short-subunit alcohol dehydrogenase family)
VKINDAVVLVTGGNRGFGKALVEEALARGARKVYATARDAATVTTPGVTALPLEITDAAAVTALAEAAPDVTLLVNNAAGAIGARFLGSAEADVRREFEVNFFGPLAVTRALVPVLEANGGGHVLDVHSVLSWVALNGSYSASKAALWSMTNAVRLELADRGIGVTGLHVGYMDTDMAARIRGPKADPRDVARQALDGVEAGAWEVVADDVSRRVKAGLAAPPETLYAQLTGRAGRAGRAG